MSKYIVKGFSQAIYLEQLIMVIINIQSAFSIMGQIFQVSITQKKKLYQHSFSHYVVGRVSYLD